MKVQIIKREIPTEISAEGGASVVIVNKDTVALETSIDEAKDSLMVVGDKLLIKGMFVGLFKSMMKGIERDGNARQLGDFLTLYPVPQGEFDLDKGWDSSVNSVKIRCRLLNEMEIDISNWEFEDVTPGRQSFTLETIQGGDTLGVVNPENAIGINGRNLPLTADIKVSWALEDGTKSGDVAPAKVVSTVTRVDIAVGGVTGLASTDSGKKIIFTVRGNYANASISATVAVDAAPVITTVKGTGPSDKINTAGDTVTITGTNLRIPSGGTASVVFFAGEAMYTALTSVTINDDKTQLVGTVAAFTPSGETGSVAILKADKTEYSNSVAVEFAF